ncbi:YgaP-like transmembrane domain [Haloarchaeobius sp. DFWS5]|uniref:YgaP-like transmembrane domain n=1 Tax=Haloarchaeobius sp. DFWS5 TaxID=3446114 RepID=UPI003EBB3BD6
MKQNVTETDQYVRVGVGSVLLFAGMVAGAGFQQVPAGALLGVLGVVLLLTGAVRLCPIRAAIHGK